METRKLKELIGYDKNPRNNESAIDHVLESLKLHGQVKPIVLSAAGHPFETEVICCGHTTKLALERFGAEEAKVVVKKFSSEREFVDLNIRDNKSGEFSSWDDSVLQDLICDFDLDDMGFVNFDEVGDDDLGDFFEKDESEPDKEPEKKTMKCPHCQEEIELDS